LYHVNRRSLVCHSERSEAATQTRKLSGRGQAFNLWADYRQAVLAQRPEMFESLALCFAAYKPSFWVAEIMSFTRLRTSLQRFDQHDSDISGLATSARHQL
jgi:hypothetical protein